MTSDWPYPSIFAHRGGGKLAPENTLAAIALGQSLGFRAHEFDVKLSKDKVSLLLHDTTLERTTNGKGRAADFTFAELEKLDAGEWHSEAFIGERLPSFERAVKLLRSKETLANVEIKPTPGFERETGLQVAAETEKWWKGAAGQPILSSFSFEALMAAKEAAPGLRRGWLADEIKDEDWGRLKTLGAVSMHTNHKKIRTEDVARLKGEGYRVMVYTVNEIETAERLFDLGIDGFFTDNLRAFAAHFPGRI
jgi:glycerophosphoryl diester phosphodiesterase